MKNKISIVSLLIAIMLIITVAIGTSYSLWTTSVNQVSVNTIDVGCFRITFNDRNISGAGDINLTNTYPMKNEAGKVLVPYKFSIENQCSVAASYDVNLETINTSTMDETKLDVYFNDSVIKSYIPNVVNGLSDDAKNAMNLTRGYLPAGESVTYSLRVWIDYNVTVDTPNVQGKVWNGRIAVSSEATLSKPAFTNKVIGDSNITLDIDTRSSKTVTNLVCYYGDKNTQEALGTAVGTTKCQYPLDAEYAKYTVTYSDGTSDSSYVQKLVDDKTISQFLVDLKANGATDLEYDGTDSLGEYGTPDNNLRYIGVAPNNYAYFNCSTTNLSEMNDTTCEKWRIIGLFNNIEDENGNSASRIKIMRDESLGEYTWDSSSDTINGGAGINQWGESTHSDGTPYEGADLMRELNTDYLGNVTVGTDGKWFSGFTNEYHGSYISYPKYADIPTSIINNKYQKMIQTVKWKTGANGVADRTDDWTPKKMYGYERSDNSGKVCSGGTYCNDDIIRKTYWIGKVGLIYLSDYGYTTIGQASNSNNMSCLITTIYGWTNCATHSWMYNFNTQWTLSLRIDSISSYGVFPIKEDGSTNYSSATPASGIRPALYLKNNVNIFSGDGSSSNPYKLVLK